MHDVEYNLDVAMTGKFVLLLGAGGAARGAAPAILARDPARLTIANRDVAKAQALAETFAALGKVEACGYAELEKKWPYDVVFNSTSASWDGKGLPVPSSAYAEDAFAYDLVYGKGLTPFLREARLAGARGLADGVGMLVEQAAEAFQWWRGVRPQTRALIKDLTIPLV